MQNKHSTPPSLMSSPESSFLNLIFISDSLDDFRMLILSFFEDLFSLSQIAFFIAGFFDSEKDFFA